MHGWFEALADFTEDMSFSERNDQFIEKMAFVGDLDWKDLVLLFTVKDLRKPPIKYFPSEHEDAARIWLSRT